MSSPSSIGNEHQVRGRADPDAAEADFEAADEVQAFHEDGALVELAVAVGVLEDQDAVLGLLVRRGAIGIRSTPRRPRAGRGRRGTWRSAAARPARRRRA